MIEVRTAETDADFEGSSASSERSFPNESGGTVQEFRGPT